MMWRRPDAQLAPWRRQRVGENEGALVGQPNRGLVAAGSVVESNQPPWKLVARLDDLKFGLGDVLAKEEARAEPASAIAEHEKIDVCYVIRLKDEDSGGGARVEPLPDSGSAIGRRKRIQTQRLTSGLDARRGHDWLPALSWLPVGMLETPDPQARRHIPELHLRLGVLFHLAYLLRISLITRWHSAHTCRRFWKSQKVPWFGSAHHKLRKTDMWATRPAQPLGSWYNTAP